MEGLIKSYEDKEKELRKFESDLLDSYGAKLIAPLIRFIQLIISNNPISVNKKLIQLKRILNDEKMKFDESYNFEHEVCSVIIYLNVSLK